MVSWLYYDIFNTLDASLSKQKGESLYSIAGFKKEYDICKR